MRDEHLEEMDGILGRWDGPARVLDVGSLNVNGSFCPLIEGRGWDYVGLDIAPGDGVDVVSDDPYSYPFEDRAFDIVISGSTMEHVEALWRWVPELVRLVRPGGMLAIVTHTHWKYHPHPADCWRIMPDGMRYLFDLTGALANYDIRMINEHDIIGVATRIDAPARFREFAGSDADFVADEIERAWGFRPPLNYAAALAEFALGITP